MPTVSTLGAVDPLADGEGVSAACAAAGARAVSRAMTAPMTRTRMTYRFLRMVAHGNGYRVVMAASWRKSEGFTRFPM